MNKQDCTRPLRVAVIFEYPSLNGGEFSWLAAVPTMRTAGIEPIAIAPDEGPLADRLRQEKIHVENWQVRGAEGKLDQSALRDNLAQVLDRIQPDLIHANSLSTTRTIGPLAERLKIPSIGHIRDIVRLSRKAVDDINQCDRLLAVSHATRDWHVHGGVDPRKLFVQYNGVDLDHFEPSEEQSRGLARHSHRSPGQLIGSIGQLGIRKGTEKLLEAAQLIAADFPNAHWVIAGERHSEKPEAVEFEANLHRLASSEVLNGRVHFVGRIHNDHIAAWMQTLTMLVHTARQEPLGRVLLEAAAAGVPIVATDAGGTREVLGQHGHIVPIDDVEAIARSMRNVLSDRDDSTAQGRLVRRRVQRAFPIQRRGEQLLKHYQTTVREAGKRHESPEIG